MNLNGLINRLIRMFTMRAINTGINTAARRGKSEADMTPEERARARAQAKKGREIAKRARQAARITRRMR
ncbi:MAG: hypothetical protein Q4G36_01605 [Paracoccus sp. (in: a-proteobacteria)]|nr:hypothetical protein [Paracoccus sp. (in: a-proteobacteria)]